MDGDVLDLRGVGCPANYVRVRLALEPLGPGDALDVLLDAGEPMRNVPGSLRDDGDRVVSIDASDGFYRLTVMKGEPADAW